MKPKTATRIIGAFIDAIETEVRRIERDTYDVVMSKEALQSNMGDLSDLKKVKSSMEAGDLYKAIDILIVSAKEKPEVIVNAKEKGEFPPFINGGIKMEEIYNVKITIHLVDEKERVFVDKESVNFDELMNIFSNCFKNEYPLLVDGMYNHYEMVDDLDYFIGETTKVTANEEIGYAMVTLNQIR